MFVDMKGRGAIVAAVQAHGLIMEDYSCLCIDARIGNIRYSAMSDVSVAHVTGDATCLFP
jgi:hypothetical protein